MVRHEFEALYNEQDKCVMEDVAFRPTVGNPYVYSFDDLPVVCQSGVELFIHGSYSCLTAAVSFNFTVKGVGPITRYCAGGMDHGNAGRFHQHLLRHQKCPRQNLPYAEARPTLEGLTALEVWQLVARNCRSCTRERFGNRRSCANEDGLLKPRKDYSLS